MALTKLDNLYRQVILDHSSHPHHRGTLGDSTYKVELNNPTCGDVIHLELAVEGETIKDVAFTGEGCSISTCQCFNDGRCSDRQNIDRSWRIVRFIF